MERSNSMSEPMYALAICEQQNKTLVKLPVREN